MDARLKYLSIFSFSLFLAGAFFASCDNRKDETDLEELSWVYLYITRPTNLLPICVENYDIGFECVNTTGVPGADQTLVATLESVYTISVPSPRDTTALCNSLINSPNFPVPGGSKNSDGEVITFSTGTKACIFNCSGEFWQDALKKGDCTAENFQTISFPGAEEEGVYATCFEDCTTVGTVL